MIDRRQGGDMTESTGFAVPLATTWLRLVAAVLIGGVIGVDRELHHKPAGLRTHGLVALGAALITLVAIQLSGPGDFSGVLRAVQGIITGIGFLGAGVILHPANQSNISGLTTAASIWVVSGLGIGCGAGLWGSTLSAFGLVLLILVFGGRVERIVSRFNAARSNVGEP
jgi:putative Mg2+ transporter-C (MgtC) family protein